MKLLEISPREDYILNDYDPNLAEVLCSLSEASYFGKVFQETLFNVDNIYEDYQYFESDDIAAYGITTDDFIIIVFKGSRIFEYPEMMNISPYANIRKTLINGTGIHSGYYEYYLKIQDKIRNYVSKHRKNRVLLITGHSLGAALAAVSSIVDYPEAIVYAIGSPRAITNNTPQTTNIYTIFLNTDFICNWPSALSKLTHAGNRVYISKSGNQAWKNSFLHSSIGNLMLLIFTIMLPISWALGLRLVMIRYSLKTHTIDNYKEAIGQCVVVDLSPDLSPI